MPFSRNPSRYSDVKNVLDQALRHNGARYSLPSHSSAINWRFRAYTFMKLMANLAAEAKQIPGQLTTTPYDNIVLTIEKDSPTVIVAPRKLEGVLEVDGPEIDLALSSPDTSDPLLEEAKRLIDDL